MTMLLELLAAAALAAGGFFLVVGALGVVRLPDFYMRLHAPTKASTLGVGGMLVGAMLAALAHGTPSLRELLITLFVFLTAPVAAHLLARAGLALGARSLASPPPPPGSQNSED